MRAGIYVRISRDHEGWEAGVDRQEADCRALADRRGWDVVGVYSDNDVSATDRRKVRNGYRRLIADLEAGRLDAVMAYSSSRLYRRARDLEELITLLEQRHAKIATVVSGEINLATVDGRMVARLLAAADQAEAERIGERSTRAKADLKKNGAWLGGGGRAYGYERVKDERGKVREHRVVGSEAAVLREVADRALAGESLTRLSAELNRRGVPTSQGGRWQPSKLRQLLTSPFHAGRFPDRTRGTWPAIFSDDEATLLRARFPRAERAGVGRGRGPRPGRAYVLAGLAVCSECDRKLLGSAGAYRCQARNGGCGRVRIPSWLVDRYVLEQMWTQHYREIVESEQQQRERTADTEPLLAELRAAEARLFELHEAYAAGEITLDDFKQMRDAVGRRVEAAEARLREMAPAPAPTRISVDEIPAEAKKFRTRWQRRELSAEEVAELNDFFRGWVEKVVVSPARRRGRPRKDAPSDVPDRVQIVWRDLDGRRLVAQL
jgi:DNA invertase Pin-like site-specific DNA recombinase